MSNPPTKYGPIGFGVSILIDRVVFFGQETVLVGSKIQHFARPLQRI